MLGALDVEFSVFDINFNRNARRERIQILNVYFRRLLLGVIGSEMFFA